MGRTVSREEWEYQATLQALRDDGGVAPEVHCWKCEAVLPGVLDVPRKDTWPTRLLPAPWHEDDHGAFRCGDPRCKCNPAHCGYCYARQVETAMRTR